LRGKVALVLAPALHLLEPRARHQVRREHSRGAQLGHDVRHVDVRMAVVVAREQLLAASLEAVIDLLLESLRELLHQRARVEAGKSGADHSPQQGHVAQVRGDAARDAWVLDLDRHGAAVASDGAVHLADRGSRERKRIPPGEDLLRRSARRARAAPRPARDCTIAAPDFFTIERAARCAFAPPARRRATRIPGRVCRAAGARTPFRVLLAAAWRTHRRRAPNRATFLWR